MKASPAKARPLSRFAMVPAVKSLILNRERSRTGNLVLRSRRKKVTMRKMLKETKATVNGSVRLPSVRPRRRRVKEPENATAPGMSNFWPRTGWDISLNCLLYQYVPKIPMETLLRNMEHLEKS